LINIKKKVKIPLTKISARRDTTNGIHDRATVGSFGKK